MAENSLYNAASQEVVGLFEDYLEGGYDRPFLIVSADSLDDTAKDAIEKSLSALGFKHPACSYAWLAPTNGACALDEQATLMLVEGLDPLCVICTDSASGAILGAAYRVQYKPNSLVRLWGRTSAIFENLSDLISTDQGKRTAWELFKALQ